MADDNKTAMLYTIDTAIAELNLAKAIADDAVIVGHLVKLFGECTTNNDFWSPVKYPILSAIARHTRMFNRYATAQNFEKHYDLTKAMVSAQSGKFLIYFADLRLYATTESLQHLNIFMGSLRGLLEHMNEDCEVDNIFIPVIKQIVLADSSQKLIFICENTSSQEQLVTQLQDNIQARLGMNSTVTQTNDGTEITVDNIFDNYRHAVSNYDDLYHFISDKSQTMADAIKITKSRRNPISNYIMPDISAVVSATNISDLAKLMKSFPPGVTLNALNVVINNGAGSYGTINTGDSKSIKHDATTWIRANPPHHREITVDYYNRYATTVSNAEANNVFGALVRSEGYTTLRGTKHRHWIK